LTPAGRDLTSLTQLEQRVLATMASLGTPRVAQVAAALELADPETKDDVIEAIHCLRILELVAPASMGGALDARHYRVSEKGLRWLEASGQEAPGLELKIEAGDLSANQIVVLELADNSGIARLSLSEASAATGLLHDWRLAQGILETLVGYGFLTDMGGRALDKRFELTVAGRNMLDAVRSERHDDGREAAAPSDGQVDL